MDCSLACDRRCVGCCALNVSPKSGLKTTDSEKNSTKENNVE